MITNKYKLYRNRKKNKKLDILCDSSASIWNHVVLLHKRYYRFYKKSVSKKRMRQQVAKLRKSNSYWIKLNSQTVQEIVDRVYDAYDRFFKRLAKRPPKLKKWRDFKSFVFTQSGWRIESNTFIINKIGSFKFSKSRDYCDIKNIRLKRDSVGDWWILITSSRPINSKISKKTHNGAFVGFDFSLSHFLIASDGSIHNSPLLYNNYQNKMVKLSNQLSKKRKGSKNRTKCKKQLAKVHRDLAFKRNNHHWELAKELCKTYDFIALETLNIEGMKKLWGKKISDLSFSSFVSILKHVAFYSNTTVHQIDRWFASSKTCFDCGEINKNLKLSDREWVCDNCGSIHERDVTASKNILRQGIVEYQSKCKTDNISAVYVDGKESQRLKT